MAERLALVVTVVAAVVAWVVMEATVVRVVRVALEPRAELAPWTTAAATAQMAVLEVSVATVAPPLELVMEAMVVRAEPAAAVQAALGAGRSLLVPTP